MKKFPMVLTLGVFLFGLVSMVQAQSFEGKINYSMTYDNLPEEMAGFESMLPQESTYYMKDQKIRFEQDMGMAGKQIVVFDNNTEGGFLLMDMMGNKMCIDMSPESMGDEEKPEDPEIKYLKGSKTVAGYKCKLAEVSREGENGEPGETIQVWYTTKIQGSHNQFKGLNGFPLEYSTSVNGMEVTMSANGVSKEKVDASMFEVPDGYEKMTMEEFSNMMGG